MTLYTCSLSSQQNKSLNIFVFVRDRWGEGSFFFTSFHCCALRLVKNRPMKTSSKKKRFGLASMSRFFSFGKFRNHPSPTNRRHPRQTHDVDTRQQAQGARASASNRHLGAPTAAGPVRGTPSPELRRGQAARRSKMGVRPRRVQRQAMERLATQAAAHDEPNNSRPVNQCQAALSCPEELLGASQAEAAVCLAKGRLRRQGDEGEQTTALNHAHLTCHCLAHRLCLL